MVLSFCLKTVSGDFPGGAVVKNRLPVQGARVRALVQEDPTCRGAAMPCATATEPAL